MTLASAIGWPDAAIALIAALPAIIAAFYAHRNTTQLKTGNDKTVGEMVSETHGSLSEQGTPYDTHVTPKPVGDEGG